MSMISIIVPVYNAKNLRTCVDSLIHQTYPSIDILLIDDGSTDDSGAVCDSYREMDPRVRVVHQENGGVSAARNAGLRLAASPYIMFVDSDDSLEVTACDELMREMEREPSDLMIFGYFLHQKTVAEVRPEARFYQFRRDMAGDFSHLYDSYLVHCLWNKVFVRERIDREFDPALSLGEDLMFVLAYMRNVTSVRCLDTCYYHYQWDSPDSLTMRYREDYFEVGRALFRTAMGFCQECLGDGADCEGICHVFLRDCNRAIQLAVFSKTAPAAAVKATLKDWISDPSVRQAADCARAKTREEKLLAEAARKGRVGGLYGYYAVKRRLKKVKQLLMNRTRVCK